MPVSKPYTITTQRQAEEERARVARILANEQAIDLVRQRAYAKNEGIILSHFNRGWGREKLSGVWGRECVDWALRNVPKPSETDSVT